MLTSSLRIVRKHKDNRRSQKLGGLTRVSQLTTSGREQKAAVVRH